MSIRPFNKQHNTTRLKRRGAARVWFGLFVVCVVFPVFLQHFSSIERDSPPAPPLNALNLRRTTEPLPPPLPPLSFPCCRLEALRLVCSHLIDLPIISRLSCC